jgi:8-oxo-dGTP pyrophosphatase MutT (NUDIX family)
MKRLTSSAPKITSTEIKYQNPWITVHEDKVMHPSGKPGIFGVVNYGTGAAILPIDDDGNVYLVREYKYALQDWSLEVAAGGIDPNEKPGNAARRELLEELGITADQWTYLGAVHPFTTIIKHTQHQFIARSLHFQDAQTEDSEQIEPIKMPLHQAVKFIETGKIISAPTIALILRAKILCKN